MARLTVAALLACVGAAAADFCTDYAASDCAATPFHATHSCSAHFDMITVAQQSCVIYHLNAVDSNTSAHCAHARGESPCAADDATNHFCDNYAASDCAATPFHATHTCPDHYAMLSTAQQACVVTHLNAVDSDTSAHCGHARGEGPCVPADFCADYAASDCAGTPFHATHSCPEHLAMLSTASQACVAEHLAMVDSNTSAHCAHARGEAPCDLADDHEGLHDHEGNGVMVDHSDHVRSNSLAHNFFLCCGLHYMSRRSRWAISQGPAKSGASSAAASAGAVALAAWLVL